MSNRPIGCRCHNRVGLTSNQHENDCPLAADLPRLTPNPDGGWLLHLPDITHLDTQVWSVDIGLTDKALAALRAALNEQATP
ncbi:hypothetical protein [Streptomyces sp. WM6349]|uniref:hypothetical protein n=1 Tax=Streptomyces sp. WM6349 TaxID=1415552 RepID=UPI0006AE7AEF|nr:hypothetical protein [Streptomyces sp. WM6349]KOU17046.1 hypothetical protein ADK49_17060 [Streptomyces sp. WM6349]